MGLRELEAEYWAWRTVTAPDTSDDLPRLQRPAAWARTGHPPPCESAAARIST